ncbi:phage minor head protein [Notoacmeibacter ruber]|uniref:Phage head morphogenesis domain-containing protein n=1 Tax=Notoacmeibacter ruber TaxID=2670375 RepID=A0A3L7JEL9_9HYPH|nr:phage minor head protein [Notoacmeibacter ruber]RLQ88904.1 hypothetical protein D8780_12385 [Notoacmeibacter ruber]
MAEISRGLQTPEAVTSYFDGKINRPGFSWQDVWAEEHAYAFTVAKAVDAELLGTFKSSIGRAIAESRSFDNWKHDIEGELRKLGWWRPRKVADPTGELPDRVVDFSSRRRLETIFWSNMRSARAAGQWERAQRTKAGLPFLLYVRTASAEPRPEHLAFAGIILPVDHPFWQTHFPPNGWGCKCSVRQITRREAESLLAERDGDGRPIYTDQPIDFGTRSYLNRRTGEVTEVPVGIDPGWHTNPGLSRSRTLLNKLHGEWEAVAEMEGGRPDAVRIATELWADPFLKLAPKLPGKTWLPAGVSANLAAVLDAKSPIISIEAADVAARLDRIPIGAFSKLPTVLDRGYVMADPREERMAEADRVRLVWWRENKTWWEAIIVRSATGHLRVRSFHERNGRRVIRDVLAAGGGAAELRAAGFTEAEIEKAMKGRRGEGNNPIG